MKLSERLTQKESDSLKTKSQLWTCLWWREWKWRKEGNQSKWAVLATEHWLLLQAVALTKAIDHAQHTDAVYGIPWMHFLQTWSLSLWCRWWAIESTLRCGRNRVSAALTGALQGNLLLSHCQSHAETGGLLGVCISLGAGPPRNLLLTPVSFRAGSELTAVTLLSRHKGNDAFTGLHSSAHLVFTQAHHNPTVGNLGTYTGSKWCRCHWRWTCWGGACEWPRSSGAGKGWCAPWVQTSSPAQQSHWDSQRCTWWWFAPRREWAQSTVFQYGKSEMQNIETLLHNSTSHSPGGLHWCRLV